MRHRRFFKTLLALFLVLALLGTAACGGKKDDGGGGGTSAAEDDQKPARGGGESKPEVRETEAEIVEVPNDIIPSAAATIWRCAASRWTAVPITLPNRKDGEIRGLYKGQLDASTARKASVPSPRTKGPISGNGATACRTAGAFSAAEDETSDAVVEYVEGDFVDGRLVKGLRSFRDFNPSGITRTAGPCSRGKIHRTPTRMTGPTSKGRLKRAADCSTGSTASARCRAPKRAKLPKLTADDDGNIVKELKAEKTVGADTPDVWIVSTFENHDRSTPKSCRERQDPEFYRNPRVSGSRSTRNSSGSSTAKNSGGARRTETRAICRKTA